MATATCSVAECERTAKKRGYCIAHYRRCSRGAVYLIRTKKAWAWL